MKNLSPLRFLNTCLKSTKTSGLLLYVLCAISNQQPLGINSSPGKPFPFTNYSAKGDETIVIRTWITRKKWERKRGVI